MTKGGSLIALFGLFTGQPGDDQARYNHPEGVLTGIPISDDVPGPNKYTRILTQIDQSVPTLSSTIWYRWSNVEGGIFWCHQVVTIEGNGSSTVRVERRWFTTGDSILTHLRSLSGPHCDGHGNWIMTPSIVELGFPQKMRSVGQGSAGSTQAARDMLRDNWCRSHVFYDVSNDPGISETARHACTVEYNSHAAARLDHESSVLHADAYRRMAGLVAHGARTDETILDAGCGTGTQGRLVMEILEEGGLQPWKVHFTDRSTFMLGSAMNHVRDLFGEPDDGEKRFHLANFCNTADIVELVGTAGGGVGFDRVVAANVIDHYTVGSRTRVISNLLRLCKLGGHLYLGATLTSKAPTASVIDGREDVPFGFQVIQSSKIGTEFGMSDKGPGYLDRERWNLPSDEVECMQEWKGHIEDAGGRVVNGTASSRRGPNATSPVLSYDPREFPDSTDEIRRAVNRYAGEGARVNGERFKYDFVRASRMNAVLEGYEEVPDRKVVGIPFMINLSIERLR